MGRSIMTISLPHDVQFGDGCLRNAGKKARELGMKTVLIVCDPTMMSLGPVQELEEGLSEVGLGTAIFDKCIENPTEKEVDEGTKVYNGEGCDGLISIGGGSVIDVAKAIRVVAGFGGSILDYDILKGGMKKIDGSMAPHIAIPTTAGTGSEATISSVIIDTSRKVKTVIFSPHLMSSSALLDPELTLTLPETPTAATGLDAFIHALEAFVSRMENPLSDGVCRTNFELVGRSLKKAVEDGSDVEARGDMLMASLLGGMALTLTGIGVVHALSHQLTSTFGIAHGMANSLMLPHVMRFNAPVAESRYVEALRIMGFEAGSADEAADVMAQFAKELGLPGNLSELGVKEESLGHLAEDALADIALRTNPVKCEKEDLLDLYRKAM